MTILKPWMQVALALAVGFGLGLLTHGARAANVEAEADDQATIQGRIDLCVATGNISAICHMRHLPERSAFDYAMGAMLECQKAEVVYNSISTYAAPHTERCLRTRGYVIRRWGY
jgi:hypothetical protein